MTTTGADAEAGARGAPAGPWWWARRRAMVLDVLLAVASMIECTIEGITFADKARIPAAIGLVLGLAAGASLLLRRRWPIAVVLVSVAITPAEMGFLLGIVGLYTLAASDVPRRITVALAGMSMAGTLLITFINFHQDLGQEDSAPLWANLLVSIVLAIGLTAPPLLLGLYAGARRRLVESLRERADGLERELSLLAERAEERAEWARNEERTRIAREMHDVVAHRVSLMVVHSAALQAIALKDPERAAKNAALVGDMGRQALTELREMLGVLRTGGERTAASAALAEIATTGARPTQEAEEPDTLTLGELEKLIGESRAAGMTVELSVEGEERSYPPQVEQTAYRVVQEALTNVHKHAAGAKALVRLAHRDAEVAVLVENGPPAEGASGARLPSGGNGLIGMRERVTALGGGFVSGPTDTGGFRVSAVLPDGANT
ncbi:sensor histidine kinase [Streptomyces pathocidini]|uniref:histidine kinase n=1 Tax=Streptomyces pathocidini TaxID=1650571 RepID=A0ABW7UY10_9ACTN|nr:histidine kinase [Streptomyces pathocidini]